MKGFGSGFKGKVVQLDAVFFLGSYCDITHPISIQFPHQWAEQPNWWGSSMIRGLHAWNRGPLGPVQPRIDLPITPPPKPVATDPMRAVKAQKKDLN